jgi:hypothetical protein
MEKLYLDLDSPALDYFMERRKKKYDLYEAKWYEVCWSGEALLLRNKMNKKNDNENNTKMSHYVKKKLGLIKNYKKKEVSVVAGGHEVTIT